MTSQNTWLSIGSEALRVPPSGKPRRTYERIAAAARADIDDAGSLRPEAVAARADVTKATLYTYFSSKDHLAAAAFDLVLSDLNRVLADRLTIEHLLDRGLHATLQAAVEGAVEGFERDAGTVRLALSRLSEAPIVREVYRSRDDEGLRIVRRFVELGAAAGKIRHGDPDRLAAAALVLLQGCNHPRLLRRRQPGVAELVGEALVAILRPEV